MKWGNLNSNPEIGISEKFQISNEGRILVNRIQRKSIDILHAIVTFIILIEVEFLFILT